MIYCCSVCYGVDKPRTMVQGTVICIKCLEEAKKNAQNDPSELEYNINKEIAKENDIYD